MSYKPWPLKTSILGTFILDDSRPARRSRPSFRRFKLCVKCEAVKLLGDLTEPLLSWARRQARVYYVRNDGRMASRRASILWQIGFHQGPDRAKSGLNRANAKGWNLTERRSPSSAQDLDPVPVPSYPVPDLLTPAIPGDMPVERCINSAVLVCSISMRNTVTGKGKLQQLGTSEHR